MDVRSIPREQHLKVASLIMDGWSFQRALMECGFSKWTAKYPGHLLRNSRALKAAIEQERQRRLAKLIPMPVRQRRPSVSEKKPIKVQKPEWQAQERCSQCRGQGSLVSDLPKNRTLLTAQLLHGNVPEV